MIHLSRRTGFTLIELLVVVAIIGVLTAVLLVNLVGIRERGADTKKKSDLNQLKTSLRLYYNDYQGYPAVNGSGNIMGCTSNGVGVCDQAGGSTLQNASGTVYMQYVPEYSVYWVSADREQFYIGVALTNASDPDAAESATRCNVTGATTGTFYVCAD
jgi:prepilin-type N-terminal cleavage/methylation domain-containing protein